MSSLPILYLRKVAAFVSICILATTFQVIFFANAPSVNAASPTVTQLTIPSGLNNGVNDISVSDDGTKLVFVTGALNGSPYGGGVYQSLNSGATWTSTSSLPTDRDSVPSFVASTNSGQNVLIAPYSSSVLYRSADYGATWTAKSLVSMRAQCGGNNLAFVNTSPSGEASGMDMSGDGTIIAASKPFSSCMLISRDSGVNFSYISLPVSMGAVGAVYVSSSGNAIWYAKSETGGGLWKYNLSTNSWGSNLSSTVGLPRSITGSQDGTIIYAAGGDMQNNVNFSIYKSTNSGATFTALASTSKNWLGLKASSDGTKLIGWDRSNNVWISQDSGVTWEFQNNHPSSGIQSVKFSGDGSKAYMTTGNQYGSNPVTKVFQYAFPAPSTTTLTTQYASAVYGASNTLTATVSSNAATGTVNFKNGASSITGCSSQTVTAGVATCTTWKPGVGTYSSITAEYSGNGNLGGSTSSAVSLTITRTPLTITASSPTVTYGAAAPSITAATFSGLVNSDASSVVTGISCTTAYTTTSAVGSLPATSCSGGTASNYTISYTAGSVIINQATPTFSNFSNVSKTYGASIFNLISPTVTGSVPGTWAYSSGTTSVISINGTSATVAGAGTSVITATFTPTDTVNYVSGGTTTMTVTVSKATQPVVISATSTNFNLGQSDTLTATVAVGALGTATFSAGGNALCTTGVLNSDGFAQCAWTPTVAGTYTVTAAYLGDSNYMSATSSASSIVVNSVITYDTNGGTGTAPTAFTSPGTSTTLPLGTGLSKSGYTFGGWSTTISGAAVSSTYSSTTSRTLYAVWTANSYTITYNANSGSGSQSSGSYITGAVATTLPSTSTFTRAGYTFSGWATSATSTTPVTSYSTSATVTFYAIWIHGTYTVTFAANSGSGSMAAQTSNATANLNANTFTYTDRVFNGWNTSADGTGTAYSNSVSYPFLASITLYAQWGNVITFSSNGATSGSPSQTSQSWSSGAINLPTVGTMVKTGYTFGGWSNGTTTYTGGSSYTPTGGITLNPVWAPNTYSITFNKNLATSGSVPTNQSWTAGTTALTLSGNIGSPALAKSGYTFGGWATSASSSTAVTTYSTASNQTFYAIWTPISYTIAYALNGGTSTLPTQASQQIYNTFTLAATPTRADYYFAGWSDSATATTYAALATYSITATSAPAITLTAQWIPTYTLNYVLNGSTSAVTGEGTYNSGTVVTLTASPTRTGYTFNNWLDSSNVTHAAGSSFTMLQNSVLQAQWTAILYPVTYVLNGATGTLPLQSSLTINSPFTISPVAPVRVGYTFDGWSDGTNIVSPGATYVIGTSSVTLTAQWTAISYAVTYDLGGGQGTLPTQVNGSITSTFTLPATASNPTWIAHTFTGWSDGAAVFAPGSTYTFGASNVTLTAQFSLNGYTQVTYTLGSNGTGALPNPTSALEGNTITVASGAGVTRTNYAFAGWSDGSNLYQPGDIYLVGPESAPVTFVPSWTSGYNVAYSTGSGFGIAPVDPVGRVTGSTFIIASAATLNRQGFTFTGWSDGTNVVQPGATYTVGSANITLTAQWVQNSLAGIASSALTPLASFSIVNGVGPSGSFNFGSTTISYVIPVNALSPGTTVSIYGLTDTSSISGVLPTGKTVVSSTVISWLSTDGTVPDTSSPIAMTITNSEIVPGTVVYAITGSSIVNLGTATSNGSITTSITSDPVIILANPVVVPPVVTPTSTPPSNSGGGGGSAYVAPAPEETPTVDPAVAAAAKALAEKVAIEAKLAAEAKAVAEAKALAEKKAAEEAELLATLKALQEMADAEALAAARRVQEELVAAQLKVDEELQAAAALKLAEEQRIAAALAASKKITTVYSISAAFTLNKTYTNRLNSYTKKIAAGSTVTCIGYAKSSKTLTYAKAKVVATKQAKALCSSMKKINPTLKTKNIVYPASKAPNTTVNKKWIPVSYRIESPVN
jgi:uncharacterized repeat protein (TIGR02543 family)